MDKIKIIKLIDEFSRFEKPIYPENKSLQELWDSLMLYFSDYIGWERVFLEDKIMIFSERIYVYDFLSKQLKQFKPKSEEEKKCLQEMISFKQKMDQITKAILKYKQKEEEK